MACCEFPFEIQSLLFGERICQVEENVADVSKSCAVVHKLQEIVNNQVDKIGRQRMEQQELELVWWRIKELALRIDMTRCHCQGEEEEVAVESTIMLVDNDYFDPPVMFGRRRRGGHGLRRQRRRGNLHRMHRLN